MLETLASFGMVVVPDPLNLVRFEVDESDERWPAIQQWMAAHGFTDSVRTTFSQGEISSAKWLKVDPQWHYGYPQRMRTNSGTSPQPMTLATIVNSVTLEEPSGPRSRCEENPSGGEEACCN